VTNLCSIHQLIGQALSNGLDVTKRRFPCAGRQQADCLIDTPQWRHVNGLSAHRTSTTDARRVFTRSTVDHGRHDDLQWVLTTDYMPARLQLETLCMLPYLTFGADAC